MACHSLVLCGRIGGGNCSSSPSKLSRKFQRSQNTKELVRLVHTASSIPRLNGSSFGNPGVEFWR